MSREQCFNHNIRSKTKERLFSLFIKPMVIAVTYFLFLLLCRMYRSPRTIRSELLVQASQDAIDEQKVYLLAKWWFPTFINTIDMMLSHDTAYQAALFRTLERYQELKQKNKVR